MIFRRLHLLNNGVNFTSRNPVTFLSRATRISIQIRRSSAPADSLDLLVVPDDTAELAASALIAEPPITIAMNRQTARDMVALQSMFGLASPLVDSKDIKQPKDHLRAQALRESEVVFLSIDLEAYEFAQEKITEVGLSILDSRDVVDTEAGPDGASWLSKIKTRHFIIEEHRKLVNKRFVHGCPDKFDFGKSEVVRLRSIRNILQGIFRNPSPASIKPLDTEPRKIILVGHGLSNDTTFLKTLGFSPFAEGNILESMDTQKLAGSTKRNIIALRRMLAGLFGEPPKNLHNAGNDAAWTLRGLVMMVVRHTAEPDAYLNAISLVKLAPEPARQRYQASRQARQTKLAIAPKPVATEAKSQVPPEDQRGDRKDEHREQLDDRSKRPYIGKDQTHRVKRPAMVKGNISTEHKSPTVQGQAKISADSLEERNSEDYKEHRREALRAALRQGLSAAEKSEQDNSNARSF